MNLYLIVSIPCIHHHHSYFIPFPLSLAPLKLMADAGESLPGVSTWETWGFHPEAVVTSCVSLTGIEDVEVNHGRVGCDQR